MDPDLRKAFEREISKAVSAASGRPFIWGRDDCLMWLADIYLEVLGVDLAAEYRGKYVNGEDALRLLGRRGVVGVLITTAQRMNWPRVAPSKASIGDLGLMKTPQGPCGVIRDKAFWVGRIHEGFSVYPSEFISGAWKVTCRRP